MVPSGQPVIFLPQAVWPRQNLFSFSGLKKQASRYPFVLERRRREQPLRLLIVDFLPRLRRFSAALTGDPDKGDDLVQETCARALSRLNQWEPGTRLDSWMFRIAQNIWLD